MQYLVVPAGGALGHHARVGHVSAKHEVHTEALGAPDGRGDDGRLDSKYSGVDIGALQLPTKRISTNQETHIL